MPFMMDPLLLKLYNQVGDTTGAAPLTEVDLLKTLDAVRIVRKSRSVGMSEMAWGSRLYTDIQRTYAECVQRDIGARMFFSPWAKEGSFIHGKGPVI